jgi:hypothetical protein
LEQASATKPREQFFHDCEHDEHGMLYANEAPESSVPDSTSRGPGRDLWAVHEGTIIETVVNKLEFANDR